MAEKLSILVVEDSPISIERAKVDLASRGNLTVKTTYHDAIEFMHGLARDKKRLDMVITDDRIPFAEEPTYPVSSWDTFTGRAISLGPRIVLYAIGEHVPYIAMVSDTNHHEDEFAATSDDFKLFGHLGGNELVHSINTGDSFYLEGPIFIDKNGQKNYGMVFDCLTRKVEGFKENMAKRREE